MVERGPRIKNIVELWTVLSLWKGEAHGYRIMTEIEDATGKRPSTSQVYPLLNAMEQRGLVESRQTGSRGKKVYSLTGEGEKFVESKMEMFSSIISATIEKDLTVCAQCGCKVYEGGHVETLGGEEMKFCCRHCAETYRNA